MTLRAVKSDRLLACLLFFLLSFSAYAQDPNQAPGDTLSNVQITSNKTIGACGDAATLISAIQGNSAISPLLGKAVVVEAVVVGDYQETSRSNPARPELRGFYLQEEDADADTDPATSEGLF